MGYLRKKSILSYPLVVFIILSIYINNVYALHGVFNLKMKSENPSKLKRQTPHRMLTDGPAPPLDFHLGGNWSSWTYFAEIPVGTPPQNIIMQIDTGSFVSWVNCQDCDGCAIDDEEKGIHLKPYNPKASSTAEIVDHDDIFCKYPNRPCRFNMTYYDGTGVAGYYVKDYVTYNKATSDGKSEPATAMFQFGCTTWARSKTMDGLMKKGINGLLGLGSSTATLISQLSRSGASRNIFSICLDRQRGGGIFAVGNVVKPTVPMMKYVDNNSGMYNLIIQALTFGCEKMEVKENSSVAIDTGSDVSFIPKSVQAALADLISKVILVEPVPYSHFLCFKIVGKEMSLEIFDQLLPSWTFHFSETVSLTVHPRNYMVYDEDNDQWCIYSNGHEYDVFILGVPTMFEKLIVYDNENKSIGFLDYDCTSSVEVENDQTHGMVAIDSHVVMAHV